MTAQSPLKTIHELSMESRANILNAQNVNQKYRKLAAEEIPVTECLFGNDLKSVLSAIDSSSKLGFSMTQSHRGRKYFPITQKTEHGATDTEVEAEEARRGPRPREGTGVVDTEECINDATINVEEVSAAVGSPDTIWCKNSHLRYNCSKEPQHAKKLSTRKFSERNR